MYLYIELFTCKDRYSKKNDHDHLALLKKPNTFRVAFLFRIV